MACRGVHFAITEAEVEQLRSLPSDEEVLDYLQEVIEANAYLLGNFVRRGSVLGYEEPAPSEGPYVVYLRKEYARTP